MRPGSTRPRTTNGKELHITVRPKGHGYVRTVNGRVDKFDDLMTVLAFWNADTLKHHEFFSAVEDKLYRLLSSSSAVNRSRSRARISTWSTIA